MTFTHSYASVGILTQALCSTDRTRPVTSAHQSDVTSSVIGVRHARHFARTPLGFSGHASDFLRSVTSQAKGSVPGARFSPADVFLSGNSRQALLKAQEMEG